MYKWDNSIYPNQDKDYQKNRDYQKNSDYQKKYKHNA